MADDPYTSQSNDFPDPYKARSNDSSVWSQADRAASADARERKRTTRADLSRPTSTSQDVLTPQPGLPGQQMSQPHTPQPEMYTRPTSGDAGQSNAPTTQPGDQPRRKRNFSWLIYGAIFAIIIIVNAIRSA